MLRLFRSASRGEYLVPQLVSHSDQPESALAGLGSQSGRHGPAAHRRRGTRSASRRAGRLFAGGVSGDGISRPERAPLWRAHRVYWRPDWSAGNQIFLLWRSCRNALFSWCGRPGPPCSVEKGGGVGFRVNGARRGCDLAALSRFRTYDHSRRNLPRETTPFATSLVELTARFAAFPKLFNFP
jgi:hypothetical protein